jgi:hypothetical protein
MSLKVEKINHHIPEQPEVEIPGLKPGINFFLLPPPNGREKEISERGLFGGARIMDVPTIEEVLEGLPAPTLQKAKERIENLGGQLMGIWPIKVIDESIDDISDSLVVRNFIVAWKD